MKFYFFLLTDLVISYRPLLNWYSYQKVDFCFLCINCTDVRNDTDLVNTAIKNLTLVSNGTLRRHRC